MSIECNRTELRRPAGRGFTVLPIAPLLAVPPIVRRLVSMCDGNKAKNEIQDWVQGTVGGTFG
jgi:hypothetical protein